MALLPRPVTSHVVSGDGGPRVRIAAVSLQGARPTMEDTHGVLCGDQRTILGLFDGHAGPTCAQHCAVALPRELAALGDKVDAPALQSAARRVDKAFLAAHPDDPSGCTAAFVVVEHDLEEAGATVWVGHAGDSRVVVGRGAQVLAATEDHSPTVPLERARVEGAGGVVVDGRVSGSLAVSRAFGDRPFKAPLPLVTAEPDVMRVRCEAGDIVLLACDGLFEPAALHSPAAALACLATHLRETDDLEAALTALCRAALAGGSRDNITAVAAQLGPACPSLCRNPRYVPGAIYPDLPGHFRAYLAFAQDYGGLSAPAAVGRRYDHIVALLAAKPFTITLAEVLSEDGETSRAALREELRWYPSGPPPDLSGPARLAWFGALLAEWSSGEFQPNRGISLLSTDCSLEGEGGAGNEVSELHIEPEVSGIFHCGNDSEFELDPDLVRSFAPSGLAGPSPEGGLADLSLSTISELSRPRLSSCSSLPTTGLSFVDLSTPLPGTPAKKRRLGPSWALEASGCGAGGLRVGPPERWWVGLWVLRLGRRRGTMVKWLLEALAQLLWAVESEASPSLLPSTLL